MDELPHFPEEFLPDHAGGVILLLDALDWDLEKLSPEQLARCREILHLDNDRTVADRVRMGDL